MSVRIYRPKSNHLTKSGEILKEMPVIEKYSPDVIEFDTKEEFAEYLAEHEEEMNKTTTRKLNTQYKINGYTITKIKNVIGLRKTPTLKDEGRWPPATGQTETIIDSDTIEQINKKLDLIIQYIQTSASSSMVEY